MSKAQQTLAQAFLERISRGAVPMGGFYWIDPKALRSRNADAGTSAKGTAEASAAKALQPGPIARRASTVGSPAAWRASATAGQPAAMAWQPGATVSQPSAIAWRLVALAQRIGLFLIGAHASIREPGETMSTGCTQHAPGERS